MIKYVSATMRRRLSVFITTLIVISPLSIGAQQELVPITEEMGHDEELYEALAPFRAGVAELDQPIGYADETLPFHSRHLELGGWITDHLLAYMHRHVDERVDMMLINSGGIRTSLHQGEISTNNITEILPFENSLGYIVMDGEAVLELGTLLASRQGFNPVSGARIYHDEEYNLVRMKICDGDGVYQEVATDRTYNIGTINFLAEGAAGFHIFAEREFHDTGVLVREAIVEEIERLTEKDRTVSIPKDYIRYINTATITQETPDETEVETAP